MLAGIFGFFFSPKHRLSVSICRKGEKRRQNVLIVDYMQSHQQGGGEEASRKVGTTRRQKGR